MADIIYEDTKESSELVVGDRGELSVWVDGYRVADKTDDGFPESVVAAVKKALAG